MGILFDSPFAIEELSDVEAFGPTGNNTVEFMFSANPGEPLTAISEDRIGR